MLDPTDTPARLLEAAVYFGASSAGLVPAADLGDCPSRKASRATAAMPAAGTILVLALVHSAANPALDWWDGPTGGTPGNRQLIDIAARVAEWLKTTRAIDARDLAYLPERDGIYLKDAAVLAGLGTLGRNNLVVTPAFGPRVRLRALLIDADLPGNDPLPYHPCVNCDMPCLEACPQAAFASGAFSRDCCLEKMNADETAALIAAEAESQPMVITYCRACEMACPVGNHS